MVCHSSHHEGVKRVPIQYQNARFLELHTAINHKINILMVVIWNKAILLQYFYKRPFLEPLHFETYE
jgi:hypothetical protein